MKETILTPSRLPISYIDSAANSNFGSNSQTIINGGVATFRIAIPFLGDGSAIGSVKVRIDAGAQAGNLFARIEGVDSSVEVQNVSGLPNDTTITNGQSSAGAVTGGVEEVVELTWSTPPTPIGFHWLVLYGESEGTIDIPISYTNDWLPRTSAAHRAFFTRSYDGTDWGNIVSVGTLAVVMYDDSGKVPIHWSKYHLPYITDAGALYDTETIDNTKAWGVRFTAPENLTQLIGFAAAVVDMSNDSDCTFGLIEANGTSVATGSIYNQQVMHNGGASAVFYFDQPGTLTPGEDYRIILWNPNLNASDVDSSYFNISGADTLNHFDIVASSFQYTTADDPPEIGNGGSGTWTDDDTKLPLVQLIYEQDLSEISNGGGTSTRARVFST